MSNELKFRELNANYELLLIENEILLDNYNVILIELKELKAAILAAFDNIKTEIN